MDDAGVVDEDAEATRGGAGGGDRTRPVRHRADVEVDVGDVETTLAQPRRRPLALHIQDVARVDDGAFGREPFGVRRALPARGACGQRRVAGQSPLRGWSLPGSNR